MIQRIAIPILFLCFFTYKWNTQIIQSNEQYKCSGRSEIFTLIITELQNNSYKGTNNSDQLVIADSTHSISDSQILFSITPADTAFITSKFKKLKLPILYDFWKENKKTILLRNYIQLKENQFFESNVNTADRFVKLSNIGFDKQCDQALITYYYFCGETCGYQKFVFLQKKDTQWVIKNVITTAES